MDKFNLKNLIANHAIIFTSIDSEISIHIFMESFFYKGEIQSPIIKIDNIDIPSTKLNRPLS